MSDPKSLGIAIVDQAVRSGFHADLARHLKKTRGARIHLYSPSEASRANQEKRFGDVYDSFNVIDRIDPAQAPDNPKAVLARAAYYEDRYGIPFGWFRIADRGVGLGFSPGGFYHPRSTAAEGASDVGVIASYVRQLDFWERELRERDIDVVINGFYFEYFAAKAQGRRPVHR